MIEDSYEIFDYLPLSFKNEPERDYINFLKETFESNYKNRKYQFAFLAFHMLFMCFVYFDIWQIRENKREDFDKTIIGFNKQEHEDALLRGDNPFKFSLIDEKVILRYFKLINCDNCKIGNYKKLVEIRNNIAHSSGNITFISEDTLDEKINDILDYIKEIEEFSKPIILLCFEKFLLENWNKEEREYPDDNEQIEEILIKLSYFSNKDIEFCLNFEINKLSNNEHFLEIQELFNSFKKIYAISN
ncbi:MAG: hypothetical protein Q7S06_01875 [Nanoarchaeota archaeon]|nr:hypothetical protein [Nanoarchaeota archaeon]